jgi:hypothetical protein
MSRCSAASTSRRIAGAPPWELGIVSRDETLRGAAGRAFLAAYLAQCRGRRTD